MLSAYSFTEARSHLTAVVDRALSHHPQIIKKRKQSEQDIVLIDIETQKQLLSHLSFSPEELLEDDGSVTLALDGLSIFANGVTREEAKQDLLEQLHVYAEEYLDHIDQYRHAPNRIAHFPYIMRMALCDSEQELAQWMDA